MGLIVECVLLCRLHSFCVWKCDDHHVLSQCFSAGIARHSPRLGLPWPRLYYLFRSVFFLKCNSLQSISQDVFLAAHYHVLPSDTFESSRKKKKFCWRIADRSWPLEICSWSSPGGVTIHHLKNTGLSIILFFNSYQYKLLLYWPAKLFTFKHISQRQLGSLLWCFLGNVQ